MAEERSKSPEEHFEELVAVRKLEKEIEKWREEAEAKAAEIIAAGEVSVKELRQKREQEIIQEMAKWREAFLKEVEVEAKRIISSQREQIAEMIRRAKERQEMILEKLLAEVLSQPGRSST